MLNVEILKAKRYKKFEEQLAQTVKAIDSAIESINDQGITYYTHQVIQLPSNQIDYLVDSYHQTGFMVSTTPSTTVINSQTVAATNITFRW